MKNEIINLSKRIFRTTIFKISLFAIIIFALDFATIDWGINNIRSNKDTIFIRLQSIDSVNEALNNNSYQNLDSNVKTAWWICLKKEISDSSNSGKIDY